MTASYKIVDHTYDVIVVGAGTVRDEGYGAPRKAGQRIGVVTRSGRLDYGSDLFSSAVLGPGVLSVDVSGLPAARSHSSPGSSSPPLTSFPSGAYARCPTLRST